MRHLVGFARMVMSEDGCELLMSERFENHVRKGSLQGYGGDQKKKSYVFHVWRPGFMPNILSMACCIGMRTALSPRQT